MIYFGIRGETAVRGIGGTYSHLILAIMTLNYRDTDVFKSALDVTIVDLR